MTGGASKSHDFVVAPPRHTLVEYAFVVAPWTRAISKLCDVAEFAQTTPASSKTTRLIGSRCKCRKAFSQGVLMVAPTIPMLTSLTVHFLRTELDSLLRRVGSASRRRNSDRSRRPSLRRLRELLKKCTVSPWWIKSPPRASLRVAYIRLVNLKKIFKRRCFIWVCPTSSHSEQRSKST